MNLEVAEMGRGLLQDVRYALRGMAKARGLTLVAIVTLGLGIGANTAIFSVINALLLKPLPYANADRLVMVWQDMRSKGGPATEWTTPGNHFDWQAQKDVFESVTTFRGWNVSLSGDGIPEAVPGEQVTPDYFDVLGAHAELGRTFRADEGLLNAPRVVILSHRIWTDRFGADPRAVGRMVTLNGEPHEIIGVMPAAFRPALVAGAKVWRPQQLDPAAPSRGAVVFHTIGTLAPGVSIGQARAALGLLAKRLEREHPQSNTGVGINPVPLQEQQVGGMRPALFMLLGAVGFVLLIACVNIANLLLARASGRLREMAVRRALGADRLRIIRQLLTESVILALAGGALGLIASVWGVSALKSIAPPGTPRIDEVGIDGTVLLFASVLSLGTGLLFGVVPAWHASRDTFTAALKQGGRGQAGDGGGRARRLLIVVELALALMLLVGGGLLARSFLALQHADLGFNPDHVIGGFILPPGATYTNDAQRLAFYDRVLARAAALPGVRQAALSSVIPLGGDSDTTIEIQGRPVAQTDADALAVWYRIVSANYFSTMEIPLRRGRLFSDREPAPSIVINETMARKYWPNENAIGQHVRTDPKSPWFTIIGVVADVEVRGARGTNEVEAYLPYWQDPESGINVVLKTASDPAALAEPLRRAVRDVDPGVAVSGIATMDDLIAQSNGPSRFYATLVAIFAALALALAAVGIYGVMSYAVAQRTQEIGVRLALGAGEGQIFALVVGDSLKLAAIGLAIGMAGALVVGRALERLLFGVHGTDAATFAATATLLLLVAFTASYLPARRAMRIDPMEALRVD
jgi:putative ABC transport system permease protein